MIRLMISIGFLLLFPLSAYAHGDFTPLCFGVSDIYMMIITGILLIFLDSSTHEKIILAISFIGYCLLSIIIYIFYSKYKSLLNYAGTAIFLNCVFVTTGITTSFLASRKIHKIIREDKE